MILTDGERRVFFQVLFGTTIYTYLLSVAGLISFNQLFDVPQNPDFSWVVSFDFIFLEAQIDLFDAVPEFFEIALAYLLWIITFPIDFILVYYNLTTLAEPFGWILFIPVVLGIIVIAGIALKIVNAIVPL